MRRHDTSVSEIEFCTLYVVAERWILGCILRFMHSKNHFSDTRYLFTWVRSAGSSLLQAGEADVVAIEDGGPVAQTKQRENPEVHFAQRRAADRVAIRNRGNGRHRLSRN
jgi:hypothetical protein